MKVRLKELGTIFTGNTPSKKVDEYWSNRDIKFIKPDVIKDELCVISSANEYISASAKNVSRIVPANSILVTCIGEIGRVGITEEEVSFNQQINAIVPNEAIIPKYLAYAIYANRKQLKAIANAPVVPIINKTQFSNFEISICESVEKQNKIVRTLDVISEIITHDKKKIEALDELIKARFVEMFGAPGTNPKGWNEIKLGEVCSLQNGYAFKSSDYINKSDVLNCRMSNIRPDGGFDAEYHPKYLPEEYWDKFSGYRLFDGDVIIAMTDMASDPKILGVPTIVSTNGKKFLLNQRVGKLSSLHDDRMNRVYLMHSLGQKYIRKELAKSAAGSTQINVGKPAILNINIYEPPRSLQDQFATFVARVDKSKFAVQKSLEKTQLLFDSLMQEYFG